MLGGGGDGGGGERFRVARHGVIDHRVEFEIVARGVDAVRGRDRVFEGVFENVARALAGAIAQRLHRKQP